MINAFGYTHQSKWHCAAHAYDCMHLNICRDYGKYLRLHLHVLPMVHMSTHGLHVPCS